MSQNKVYILYGSEVVRAYEESMEEVKKVLNDDSAYALGIYDNPCHPSDPLYDAWGWDEWAEITEEEYKEIEEL